MVDVDDQHSWTTVVGRHAFKLQPSPCHFPFPVPLRHRPPPRSIRAAAPLPTPAADPVDPSEILLRMKRSMARLQESDFFKRFLDQIRSPQVLEKLRRAAAPLQDPQSCAQKRATSAAAVRRGDCQRQSDGNGVSEVGGVDLVGFAKGMACNKSSFQEFHEEPTPKNGCILLGRNVDVPRKQTGDNQTNDEQWHLQIVVYGLGKIADSEVSRCQFSLLLLLKQSVSWIAGVEVYDPVLSQSECKVIQGFGCSPISINEEGRRSIDRPTLFYMPHCEDWLYDNVLQANWTPQKLSRLVILGNSFRSYQERWSSFLGTRSKSPPTYVLELQQTAQEVPLEATSSLELPVFNNTSWHFFQEVSDRWSESDVAGALI